jgi:hypothetical protein
MKPDIAGFVDDLPAGRIARRVEVLGDCCLAVGHHALASEFLGIDEETRPSLPGNRRAIVSRSLASSPRA